MRFTKKIFIALFAGMYSVHTADLGRMLEQNKKEALEEKNNHKKIVQETNVDAASLQQELARTSSTMSINGDSDGDESLDQKSLCKKL